MEAMLDFFGKGSIIGCAGGANQTSGGTGGENGAFGEGAGSLITNGGGGGGYYGGGSSQNVDDYGGGGGSSFISGHIGCDAISVSSTSDNIIHTGQPIHYSGLMFYETVIEDGVNSESGYAEITYVKRFNGCGTSNKGAYNNYITINLICIFLNTR